MNDSNIPTATRGLEIASNDALPSPGPFSVSPFAEAAAGRPSSTLVTSPPPPPHMLNHKRLARRSKSPVARLLEGSVWVLKAWQLDLECPPSIQSWLDQRLQESLRAQFGTDVDLDARHVSFTTEQHPAVDNHGQEHFTLRLSLRHLGRAVLDPLAFRALRDCAEADRPLHDDVPQLTIDGLFKLLGNTRWIEEYEALLSLFWERHGPTWQMLARLSFLDGLGQLRRRKRISPDGYRLALDALGLTAFPQSLKTLPTGGRPGRSVVHGIVLNDEIIPGIFHLKSNTTGHCYIHVLGERADCQEYVSDDMPWIAQKVLNVLNASPWHRLHLDLLQAPNSLTLSEPVDDVIAHLSEAHRQFSRYRLGADDTIEPLESDVSVEDAALLMPIQPALELVSAQNHWHGAAPLHEPIPTPQRIARRIMGKWLKRQHGLNIDPQFVFIRYLRGTSTTPWGLPRIPATHLIVVPDEQPVALDQALMNNFREQKPQGYDDHGGRWVVYTDPSGQGVWSQEAELQITAASVEAHMDSIDFLDVLTHRLKGFWDRQGPALERSLWSTFIAQALFSLKGKELSNEGFDLLVNAVQQAQDADAQNEMRWSTLGFYLNNGLPGSVDCPNCIGLLLMTRKNRPGGVLYQAGQRQPFVEFRSHQHLINHLTHRAADGHWRKTLLQYMPHRFHARLTYILELWGDVRQPSGPVSILRPWADQLYNEDTHRARHHALCEQEVEGSPIALIVQGLRRNSLDDAEDSVVTDRELAITRWTQQAERLQLLLAPLAVLLPAVSMALLTASAATLALNIQAASLPGYRRTERRQVMFAILSLGLLQLGPATPRLLRALSRFSTPNKTLALAQPSAQLRGFTSWLQRATHTRRTVLRPFFNGTGLLKSWSVAGHAIFGTSPVYVWKLGRKFLLWTSDRGQARTLVVSSHGYYMPWTRTTAIPNGTELRTYAPHGHELVDPMLHRIASQSVQPYALLDSTQPLPGPGVGPFPDIVARDTLMAGTSMPGRIKNYALAKFQSEHYESYRDISQIVRNTHQAPSPSQLPATPMDVLTVRNRFGMSSPTLQDLFGELSRQGIHYDRILLVHCRCPAIGSMLGRAPSFNAPRGPSPITP